MGGGAVAETNDDDTVPRLPVPKVIIQHAIWLYLRFTLSQRDVEELLAERGIMVTYETGPRRAGAEAS